MTWRGEWGNMYITIPGITPPPPPFYGLDFDDYPITKNSDKFRAKLWVIKNLENTGGKDGRKAAIPIIAFKLLTGMPPFIGFRILFWLTTALCYYFFGWFLSVGIVVIWLVIKYIMAKWLMGVSIKKSKVVRFYLGRDSIYILRNYANELEKSPTFPSYEMKVSVIDSLRYRI